MKNVLPFNIPFCGFAGTTFINCFTSAFMFLENIAAGDADYDCPQLRGIPCNSCMNCQKGGYTPISRQECYFFLFDTMCGRSSLRCRFDGEPTDMDKLIGEVDPNEGDTDNNIDFIFGFAGYDYRRQADSSAFKSEITAAIDSGKPVIAKMKAGEGRFRVITGYDDDRLICPDFTNAQKKPESAPAYGDIGCLYIFGAKTAPRYLVLDGLKRIQKIMAYNIKENLWGGYTEKMGLYTSDSLGKCTIEEKQARMKRVAQTMWHTFNCHNFAEVFRKYRDGGDASVYENIGDMNRLRDPALKELWEKIGGPFCGYTHDLAWALIGLEACANWKKHAAGYFGEMVELTISQISQNDIDTFEAINKAIEILEGCLGI